MTEELLAFAIIMVIGQFSPGPDMLLLTRTALAEGLKAGALMVFGIVSGLAIHATIAIVGMAVLLEQGGWVSAAVRGLASIYLGWLAFGLLRSTQSEEQRSDEVRKSPFLRGFLCNLLNPKVFIFFERRASNLVALCNVGSDRYRRSCFLASLGLVASGVLHSPSLPSSKPFSGSLIWRSSPGARCEISDPRVRSLIWF
jgi:threonine/homoserine/homoserine lactone efflux protein